MTQSVIPGGVVGPTGPTGATGATGPTGPPGVGGTLESTLAAGVSVGGTAITLASAAPVSTAQGFIAIDPFLTTCEIRKVGTVSGTGISGLTGFQIPHSIGARVFFFTAAEVPVFWFGARGTGHTGADVATDVDDSVAVQWGLMECAREELWLDGGNRNFFISMPQVIGPSGKLKHLNLRALNGSFGVYAPVDTNSAMLIHEQNFALPFTAAASTDVFTTPSAHGMPADGSKVMFKVLTPGSTMPGGITAGKIYYARDRTTTTFKVAATSGGAAVDVTSDGSGHVMLELLSLGKVYIDDVFINGRQMAGMNGAAFELQQPTVIRKLRTDQCPGTGLTVGSGQQAIFENFEAISCGTGCALEHAQFCWFFGFDVEIFASRALHVRATPQIFALGGASSCMFDGIHIETPPVGGTIFDLEGAAHNLDFNNANITMGTGQTAWYVHNGSPNSNNYRIRGVRISGAAGTSGTIMLNDTDRGVTLDAWDDFHFFVDEIVGPYRPSSTLTMPDPGSQITARIGGGYVRWGAQNDDQPSMQFRPGSAQTGEQLLWRTSAGLKASAVNKGGFFTTQLHAAPADGDLVAGEAAFWFDQTNGAAKLMVKAKQANGTVVNGSVTLS